ncbi:GAF domain-containing hybrid sensor histidine kinase/response regulator [Larkinella rosea]|uniref:histidine kinase n=1 Tax=Larkinella rosea TaxID=2025312 RepID=A0A3P1BNY2_9BACT|nr:GAF domain-containing hybrid sensor histidine kinase/response regulator [Larkinella rosea]RRB02745.1 hybrid sensor histidine kinase/response regulator [Larkinella rosea]
MLIAPIPDNDAQRLESLRQYFLLDTAPEAEYDRVSHIASQICQTPIAMVSLIDKDRQWVKSYFGLAVENIPREISLCAHTIVNVHPLIVEDTKMDHRFWDNPAVTGPPNIIFYAGVPLLSSEGFAIGSICVIDHYPRQLAPAQKMTLQALAAQVMLLMELRRTNNRLVKARAEAEELARQKSQLLATLSHEIRTPLHALEGYTQLLIDEKPRDDQQKSLRRLQTTGRTLVNLVNNILDYSKLQAGKLVLESIPFSLSELIQQAVEMQNWRVQQKNIQLVTQIDARLPGQLKGDATRIFQVLVNLISNAIKFTEAGEVRVHVSVTSDDASEIDLKIEVSDTGIGIPPKSLALLFNEYTQVSASTTRLYGGTGLGLAICRQLLELMGSKLEVRSREGEGSQFGFRLHLPVLETAPKERSSRLSQPNDLLLAVDDNPLNTKLLAHLIAKQGGQVATFNSPLKALESARTVPYRAILLDLHMPELDGYELAQNLQELQPGVPLVAVSADDSVETIERVKSTGFQFFLRKPFLPHDLVRILKELS